jgi:HAMP domain-containing protein
VAKVWYSTASTLVDRLEAVVATLTGSVRRASHDGAIMAAVKDAAYAARDAAGLKRTLIAAIMREGRISPENRRQMAELHSVIALSSRLARAAIGEHPVPVLAAAQAAAQEAYFDRYVALRDRVEAAVDASQAPPVSIGEIDRAADVALRPLMALAEVPLAVAAASESADAAAARRDVAATGGMVVLALLCVIFIMITMRHRVLRPLGLLVEALRRVARRDYDFVLPIGSRAAEVAAMAAAIEACRDGLREADASAAAEAEA